MSYSVLRQIRIVLLVLAAVAMAIPATAQMDFYTVTPCRVYDSRPGAPLAMWDLVPANEAAATYTVPVADTCGIPADASAVAFNVTIIGASRSGFLQVFPTGTARPTAMPPDPTALSFTVGKTLGLFEMIPLGTGGQLSFLAQPNSLPAGTYHIAFDVFGYFLNNTVLVDDQATVAEDAAATAIDVLANDTDPDDTLLIASATDPANGTVVLTGGSPGAHTGLTYQPDANYCNDPPGTTLDTFTYTLTTGSSATVEVTVTCVDDDPVAVDDAATVAEDATATTIDVLANDTDVDGGPISIMSVTQPANGTVVITNGGADLTYQPDAGYCNDGVPTDDFTYTLAPGGDTATVSVTVTCDDDPPTAVNDAATVTEDSSNNAIDVLANDTDTDGGPKSVASVTQPANGTVVITGGGTGVTYTPNANYCNNPPGTAPDTFTYTLNGGSTATVSVTVTCADDNPTAVDDAATVNEDSSNNAIDVLANDTDPDGGTKSVGSVTQPANGTVAITGGGTGVSYTPNANYCNNPPGTTPDTFTYTLNGGSTATVSVTVDCSDDNPTAVNDTATVNEDSGANTINVQANDTDPDGGTNTISGVTQPANGTVTITNGGADLTYAPNANYCNNPPGTTPDTFTYTLSPGGSTATVSVTVTCVDDPPAAVNDMAVVNEDSGANTINVLANDADIDGGTNTVSGVTQPASGTVVITNGGLDLTYAPNANYCNNPPGTTPDTFTYTLSPGGSTATVSVTVACLNDGPVIDLDANDDKGTAGSDFAVTFTEGDPATLLEDPVDATVTDIDNATLASLTVTITNLLDTGNETLSADVTGTSIIASYAPATGVLTLTGPDTLANFQTVLRKARYLNSDNAPDATPRVIQFVANDGTANGNTAVSTVTVVSVDTSPTAVNDSATVNEDSSNNAIDVLANDTDPDGGPMSITSVTQPANGAVVITGGGTGVSYTPNANYCNSVSGTPDTFTYTLAPGGSTATVSVTVTCVDDNPTAVNDSATVAEDSSNNAIDVLANDTDADGGPKSVTSVTQPANGTVAITGGGTGVSYTPNPNYCNNPPGTTPDTFTYTLTPGGSSATVSVTVTCVDDNPTAVNDSATVVEDSSNNAVDVLANDTDPDGGTKSVTSVTQPANGTVAITGGGTGVSYTPNPNYCNNPPGTTPDTFTYTLTPGGSTATVSVTVTCVDDPPVAVNDPATVNEDSGASAIPVLANDTDVDGGAISITSVTQPANGAVVITGGGTGLTYAPNANYCNNPPGTTPDTFTYTLTPGGSTATVSVTVTCINDPPVADADLFDYVGNTELRVDTGAVGTPHELETTPTTFGVIDGDSDPVEGDAISVSAITFGGCTDLSAPFDCTDPAVGTLHMEANGRFHFTPAPGDTGAAPTGCGAGAIDKETFQYTLTDNGTPSPASTTGTVTLCRFARVWYVDPTAGAGNGTSATPLNSLTTLNGAGGAGDSDAAGDYIFIYDGALAGSIELEANQRLIGEGHVAVTSPSNFALSIPVNLNGNGSPENLVPTGTRPQLTNASGDTVRVTQAIPVEIVGLNLASTSGNAIDLTSAAALSGSATLTIGNNVIGGASAEGIDINLNAGTTGTLALNITSNSWAPGGTHTGNAVDITRTAGTLNLDFSGNTGIKSNNVAGSAVVINGGAVANTTITGFSGNSVSGDSQGAGVMVSNATFDAVAGGGFQQVDGDNLAIGDSGNVVGGAGMALTTVQGNLFFDDLDIYANTSGLTLSGSGGMTFAVTPALPAGSGTSVIRANGGAAVDVSSVTLDLRLDDMDSTTSGSGVSLNTVAGTFSTDSDASILKSSGGGTAFVVASSSATTSYAGTLNVSSGAGVSLTNNTGTMSFSGGMTLSTGANAGFTATGGGTVTVTDPPGSANNTITTAGGTALNVTNTTIGASGLTFERISAGTSGTPANGIVLNNTGASGGLTVTGTGSAGSGGTINSATGVGIQLTSTSNVNLSYMNVQNGGDDGIRGSTVNGLNLTSVSVSANGNAVGEWGIDLTQLTGSGSMANCTVTGSAENNVVIANTSGTLTAFNVTNSAFTSTNMTTGDDGFRIENNGSGSMALSITGGTFTDNKGDHFQVSTSASTTGSINVTFSNNTLTTTVGNDPNVVGGGITVSPSGSADVTFTISNNNIQQAFDEAINLNLGTASTAAASMIGTISNNTIGTAGDTDSGSESGTGISVISNGAGLTTVAITGNQVRQYANPYGILVNIKEGSSSMNATITGNTVSNPGSFAINGIRVDAGATTGDSGTLCAAITSNSVAGSGPGVDTDIRLRQRFNTTIRLPGYGGSNSDTTAVNSFVAGNNAGSDVSSAHNVGGGGGGFIGGAACPTP